MCQNFAFRNTNAQEDRIAPSFDTILWSAVITLVKILNRIEPSIKPCGTPHKDIVISTTTTWVLSLIYDINHWGGMPISLEYCNLLIFMMHTIEGLILLRKITEYCSCEMLFVEVGVYINKKGKLSVICAFATKKSRG